MPEIFTENTIRKSSCLGNILKFYKSYIEFQADNDSAYFLAKSVKPFRGERYSWSLQKTRTWETWFASTNIYWMPTTCKGTAESQIISFFSPLTKEKHLKNVMFWEEHYTVSTWLLMLPRTHSLIPHWVGGLPLNFPSQEKRLPWKSLKQILQLKLSFHVNM